MYGGSASFPANRRIVFEWQSLWNDNTLAKVQRYGWYSGMPYYVLSRLSAIGMYFEENEIRKYMLEYDGDLRRSKLSSLYECAQQLCKQPTTLTYKKAPSASDGNAIDLSHVSTVNLGGNTLTSVQSIFDADGDGLPDLLLNPNLDPNNAINCSANFVFAHATGDRSNPYTFTTVPQVLSTCQPAFTADMDNDGKTEIIGFPIGNSGFPAPWSLIYDPVSQVWSQQTNSLDYDYYEHSYADLNGDGSTKVTEHFDFAIDTDGDGVPNGIATVPAIPVPANTPYTYDAAEVSRDGNLGHKPFKILGFSLQAPADSAADQDSFIRAHIKRWQFLSGHLL